MKSRGWMEYSCDNLFNRVSRENSDMKKRLNKLSQEYSIHPRDFMRILPPFVFPRNSCLAACCVVDVGLRLYDVLQHGVMKKKGAFGYDHIMEIVRKQINNHGLRRGCFPTIAFAIVPYYAWDKPGLVAGDPQQGWHPKALDNPEVIGCINFQTSSNRQTGPGNRELESQTGTFWYWLQQYSEGFRIPTHRVRAKRAVTAAGSSGDARAATVADIQVKLVLSAVFQVNDLVTNVTSFLGIQDVLVIARTAKGLPGLGHVHEYIVSKARFRMLVWSKPVMELLFSVGRLNKEHAYGMLGAMEDVLDLLPMHTPFKDFKSEHRDALLYLVLDYCQHITLDEHAIIKVALRDRMQDKAAVFACLKMFLAIMLGRTDCLGLTDRVDPWGTASDDASVFLGLRSPSHPVFLALSL